MDRVTDFVLTQGRLGWGNGDRQPSPSQYDCYGPGGRWGKRQASHRGFTQGDHLADHLAEQGASEGARLIVVALPQFFAGDGTDATAERLAEQIRALVEEAAHSGG